MSTHFWFGGDDTPYLVKKSTRFDDANLSRTPSDSDPYQYGETGEISSAITNTTTGTEVIPAAISVITYTGNGGTQSITGCGFTPDLVWVKARNLSNQAHQVLDGVRGPMNIIYTNDSIAEQNATNSLTSFDADGFTVGNDTPINGNNCVIQDLFFKVSN